MAALCTVEHGITDRAKRYRAQNCIDQAEKICIFCGAKSGLMVGHVDGNESDGRRDNLAWTCRPCNNSIAVKMARAGFGKRTAQYNPADDGARSVGQWMIAVMSMKGMGPMSLRDAVKMIRATSPAKRSEFAREIWSRRREHGTDRTVPF